MIDHSHVSALQSRVNWFAFQRQDTKDALVNSPQRFLVHKSLQRLESESKLPESKRTLGSETSTLKPLQIASSG